MSGIESWSTTPANNNQAPPFGWPAGILPSQVEPIGRQMMTSLAAWYQAAEWINYNFTPTYIGATQFSLPGNATALYHVGRRVQGTDGSTSVFGTITVSAFTTLTTVTVAWDTGVLQTGVTIVYVGIASAVNTSVPSQSLISGKAFQVNNNANNAYLINSSGTNFGTIQNDAADTWSLGTTAVGTTLGTSVLKWTKAGNVTISAPASGAPVTINGASGAGGFLLGTASTNSPITADFTNSSTGTVAWGGVRVQNSADALQMVLTGTGYTGSPLITNGPSGEAAFIGTSAGVPLSFVTNNTERMRITSAGVVQAVDDSGTLQTVGWRDIPQNLQTISYQLVLADRGKGVDFNGTTLTCTIPANASVAFPIGTTILITNLNASNLSIAITTDTLTLAGTTTTGTRTLGQNGEATIRKVTSASWLISGSGLS